MSRDLGKKLTGELFKRLNGEDVASKIGKAIVLISVDDKGWGHPAMLSYHEVVAKDRWHIDLAVGKTSTTAKNLRRTGNLTLVVTDSGVNYYLKGQTHEIKESMAEAPMMSLFRVRMEQLLEDQEPSAAIMTGVTFSPPRGKKVTQLIERVFREVLGETLS